MSSHLRPRDPAQLPLVISESALLLVHLSVIVGFIRLYDGTSFVGALAGFTVGAHVVAVVVRRRRVPAGIALAIALVGAVLASVWLLFPSTAWFGLPTGRSWDVAREALRVGRVRFKQEAAPAPVIPGFQLSAGLALYGAVWFADWAAFRLRAAAEAVAPATVLFVFGALLGSGQHRFSSAVVFTGAVLCFVASHRALQAQLDHAWLTRSPVLGPRAVLRAGVGLAVIGLVGGAVVGPRLPGSEANALVRLRSEIRTGGVRSTISPIVDLRKRLVNQSDTVLFTVRTNRRAYWRLTSLDTFDGQLWSSGGQFSPASGRLPGTVAPPVTRLRSRQLFNVRSLAAIWAPAAYQARSLISTSEGLRWDPESSTLIVDAEATSDGLQYDVLSEPPIVAPERLAAAGSIDGDDIEKHYEGLPADFPAAASDTARRVTSGVDDRYGKALALQDFFRDTFTYSLDVQPGHSDDALVDFLDSRRGYCEQFAGAYAAMARSIGIPSRVAVGFTPGDADPEVPDLYIVRGKHAHAWPELWFPDIGWIPFEPTPGRGIPDAEGYTRVPEQQDDSTPLGATASTTSTTAPGTTTTSQPGSTVPADPPNPRPQVVAGAGIDNRGASGLTQLLLFLAVIAGLWLAVVLLAPVIRRRRRHSSPGPASAVLAAWQDGLDPIRWLTGLRPKPAETHAEFSRRAAAPLAELAVDLRGLARLAANAAWNPAGSSTREVDQAEAIVRRLHAEAQRRQGRFTRLRRRLSWSEALAGAPRPTAAY